MNRLLCALAVAACACGDNLNCSAVAYIDGFELLIEDTDWNMARYRIEVSFVDRFGAAAFRCDVPVPALDGTSDAGLALDGGVDARGLFSCVPTLPSGRYASGQAGQALLLGFEGTPRSVHLVVSDGDAKLLDGDLDIAYQELPRECDTQTRGAVRVRLP